MKKCKSLALLTIIALVINIFAPAIVNADLIIDGKAALEVFQSDESGLATYSGNELKVTIDGNSTYGSFWDNVDVGSNITLEYNLMENYVFDGWYEKNNEVVSTNPTYSFVMESQDYTLRAQISRADGKSARLEANPFWTDFGWHTPDFEVDYRTITVTNNGNLTIKNLTLDYDNTKLDLIYDSNDDVFDSMAPGESFTYQVKPISGAFEIAEYPHDEWILFNGYIDLDEQNQFYHSEAIVEIGINETG